MVDADDEHCSVHFFGSDAATAAGKVAMVREGVEDGAGRAEVCGLGWMEDAFLEGWKLSLTLLVR